MAELKRIGVLSVGKILGLTYCAFGLIGGVFFTISMLASGVGVMSLIALIAIPVIYGIMAAVMGIIAALVYNLIASKVGGIQLEIE